MSRSSGRSRRCLAGLVALGACSWVILAVPASASTNRPEVARPAATEPPPELLSGVSVSGATIATPGATVRKLDANQATAFMQAWLPDSVYTKLPNVKPPANLAISHMTVVTVFNHVNEPLKVFYASDGITAWVGMPAQGFGWAGVDHERWIAAPQSARVRQAFAGKLQPVRPPPASTTTPSSTTRPKTTAATDGGSGSSTAWWLVGGAAVVVAGALILTLRRRSTGAPAPRSGSI
ncbi:MAG: hypothetical protein QOF59_2244 [Actinomycetota bacterium]|nr:hypothetical protein [Actinomycetota bacterium]